ncbi:MAG: GNAT family N-acetyltransferase [Microbacteriaceae bacterium]
MSTSPLNVRVTAPTTLTMPNTDGYVWRPATLADIDAIADCARESSLADHPNYIIPRDEIAEEFDHSYFDASTDSLVAVGATGDIDAWGYATLSPGQETLVRSILFGGVRPSARGRGLGRRVVAWQEARGRQQLASSEKSLPGWIMAYAETRVPSAISTFERAGFGIARYYLELRRSLAETIVDRALPEGVSLHTWTPDSDADVRDARNDSFRDHWGSQPITEEQWNSYATGAHSRRDLSVLAVSSTGEVVGFVLTSVTEDDWAGQGFSSGYIDLVGVRRAWRGKGIAPALLGHAMVAMQKAGLEQAVLDVDAENPSGALGFYEAVGFAESNRSVNLRKVF